MRRELSCARTLSPSSFQLAKSYDPDAIHGALSQADVAAFYPGFRSWFFGKVVPGVRGGERRIIASFIDGSLAGIAVCKRTRTEKKLCTLWVSPESRGRGIASELAGNAFSWLGTASPLFTVPEERLTEFGGLLRSWSFSAPEPCQALYRPERVEYVFNGCIGRIIH